VSPNDFLQVYPDKNVPKPNQSSPRSILKNKHFSFTTIGKEKGFFGSEKLISMKKAKSRGGSDRRAPNPRPDAPKKSKVGPAGPIKKYLKANNKLAASDFVRQISDESPLRLRANAKTQSPKPARRTSDHSPRTTARQLD
jgi:hypothetical protein